MTLDQTDWLLGGDAAVRARALTALLSVAEDAPEVREARRDLMTQGPAAAILAAQLPDGHWESRDRLYTAKYRGTVWSLIILAELGAVGADPRVRAACEAILRDAQDPVSGGFSMHRSKRAGGGLPSEVIPCLTGNMVFSLVRLGMLDDPRVQRGLDWITARQRFDDGDGDGPTGNAYEKYEMCWGRHTCHMGAVKALKALAAVPRERRTPAMRATIGAGAEYLLRHHVHKRSHNLNRLSKPGWRRFGFPLMYQTDVLEILAVLTKLGSEGEVALGADAPAGVVAAGGTSMDPTAEAADARREAGGTPILDDERLCEALDLVASKADDRGRWTLEQTLNDKFVTPIETKGEPSRWITLRALEVLRAAGRSV